MVLKDISVINTGLVLSRKKAKTSEPKSLYKYRTLTLSSATQEGINTIELDNFSANEKINKKYITQKGDVIVRLSAPNYSIVISSTDCENILIPSQFLCLRVSSNDLLPEYLNIYLNSKEAQRQINKLALGTVIKVLNVTDFSEINIPMPTLAKQHKIIEFYRLMEKQTLLANKLRDAEQIKNNYYLEKLLEESCHDNQNTN